MTFNFAIIPMNYYINLLIQYVCIVGLGVIQRAPHGAEGMNRNDLALATLVIFIASNLHEISVCICLYFCIGFKL